MDNQQYYGYPQQGYGQQYGQQYQQQQRHDAISARQSLLCAGHGVRDADEDKIRDNRINQSNGRQF